MKLRAATAISAIVVALGGLGALGSVASLEGCEAGFVETAAQLYRASVDPHPLIAGL